MAPLPVPASTRWQGPVRIAVAIFLAGVLVVWLVKPIGNACPDLNVVVAGSSASSSPSFSPPLTRTCTYTIAGGTRATARYVPWLDWLVLLVAAAAVAGVAGALSPAARGGGGQRPPREDPAARGGGGRRPLPAREDHAPAPSGERDEAERERARRERAQRNRPR